MKSGLSIVLMNAFFDHNVDSRTRDHSWQIVKKRCKLDIRKYFISDFATQRWNHLPQDAVDQAMLNGYKMVLNKRRIHASGSKLRYVPCLRLLHPVASDFRPISITPVLTRIMERIVVSEFLYPAFLEPPTCLDFHDQYAFRPTGSTTAALISLLQAVTDLLSHNP